MDIKNGNLIEDNPTIEKPKQQVKLYFFILAIIALLATNVYYAIRYKNVGKQVEILNSEKSQLEIEIDRIEAELNRVTGENIDLVAQYKVEHDSARALIADLRMRLSENTTIDQADLLSTQQEIRRLRNIVADYKSDLEALREENITLKNERDNLQTSINEVNAQVRNLETANTKLERQIESASDLKISTINIHALKVKGENREDVETKARRADKLEIKFTLSNNPLAKAGKYEIYSRITEPSGNLITAGDIFKVNDEDIQYTKKNTIDFTNDGKEYTIDWSPVDYAFQKGTYTVILYTSQSVMGRSTIDLK